MTDWQEMLVDQQISAAFAVLMFSLKNETRRAKFEKAILKFVALAKQYFPDAEVFKA